MNADIQKSDIVVDVTGETCPIPLVEMRKAVMKSPKGHIIEVVGTHAASKKEIPLAVESLGLKLLKIDEVQGQWHIFIQL
jgi:TusA-related sulfurtransferase